ncbi:MAG: transposase, partial [Candidatus Hydrothermarchaeota archaeon]
MRLVSSSHSVGRQTMQFTPKYRRDIFKDEMVKKACAEAFEETAEKYGFEICAMEFGA